MNKPLDLNKLLREMEQAFIQREPLPDHFIKPLDQHTREAYAAMLAAIMLADGNLQENQSRLFSLLCTALGLSDGQTKALHQATQISSEHIVDFCRLAEEQNFAVSFLADSLILSRIDSPITHNQNQLLNQWCMLLRMPNSHIETAVVAAANTLGIATNLNVDIDVSIDQFKVWADCIYRPINEKDCTQSTFTTGYWLIDKDISFKNTVTFENQILKFSNDATLTLSHTFELIQCTVIQPKIIANINTEDAQFCTIENSTFTGDYKPASLTTALELNLTTIEKNDSFKILITNNSFETNNARTIKVNSISNDTNDDPAIIKNVEVIFDSNKFQNCGNDHLPGGAIMVANTATNFKIHNCSFTNCKAFIGGALHGPIQYFYKEEETEQFPIWQCKFTNCTAYYFSSNDKTDNKNSSSRGGGGIWITKIDSHKKYISSSKFNNASIEIVGHIYRLNCFNYCTFQRSMIVTNEKISYHEQNSCDPNPRDINLTLQDWQTNFNQYKHPTFFTKFTYPMPQIWET